jgi:hypothetical protein
VPKLAQVKSQANKEDVERVEFFWTSDPSESILSKKLNKNYHVGYSVELLCYTASRVVTSDDVIIPTILALLGTLSVTQMADLSGATLIKADPSGARICPLPEMTDPRRFTVVEPPPFGTQFLEAGRPNAIDLALDRSGIHRSHV